MLIDLDLADRPLVIGAHSMGAALALRWAARRGAGVERIVCWGAPVYSDANAVDEALVSTGLMARLFAADTRWARRACEWNWRRPPSPHDPGRVVRVPGRHAHYDRMS